MTDDTPNDNTIADEITIRWRDEKIAELAAALAERTQERDALAAKSMRMALACCCYDGKPISDEILAARDAEVERALEDRTHERDSLAAALDILHTRMMQVFHGTLPIGEAIKADTYDPPGCLAARDAEVERRTSQHLIKRLREVASELTDVGYSADFNAGIDMLVGEIESGEVTV